MLGTPLKKKSKTQNRQTSKLEKEINITSQGGRKANILKQPLLMQAKVRATRLFSNSVNPISAEVLSPP